jgi:hypothetical protein
MWEQIAAEFNFGLKSIKALNTETAKFILLEDIECSVSFNGNGFKLQILDQNYNQKIYESIECKFYNNIYSSSYRN